MSKKLMLMILDGWGLGDGGPSDAIKNANTPFIDNLYNTYPHSTLSTSGEDVGLPEGQMGNSEVGHLNIGAGRVVYQDLVKINKAIAEKTLDQNSVLIDAFDYAKKNDKAVHLLGLVSEGGVHSSQAHLHRLCELANESGLQNIFIHAFTDGRDTDPKSGLGYLNNLQNHIQKFPNVKIASVMGRYYSMDRDKRWERVKVAYDAMVLGKGEKSINIINAVNESYSKNITDEFILPIINTDALGNPVSIIRPDEVVICFNFRTDRCREITMALSQQNFPEHQMKKLPLYFVTMTKYDETFKNVHIIFDKDNLNNTLGEVLAANGKKQIRIAETEKYPHVTFFFSGGREQEFLGEKRILVASPKVATYDLKPEMSAPEISSAIVEELRNAETDFICLNFANPDMVGHTGVYEAVVKAVETVDECARKVVNAGLKYGYSFLIIADHGNADYVLNSDGSPNTAHTTNPVPCILIDNGIKKVANGKLADIAPTILTIMGLDVPEEMTGNALV
jgi:2,3-bisphosphoglycerate-independent phosphoglycerate mutase